ncbi:hypothetical protein Q9L58_009688 [Maublancomyces gigas]|uniref:VWFA domain-containing protein n=1 Tax=Discina gigas TaxID=1032678 RepID=A0ABR3G6F0_9PEZI
MATAHREPELDHVDITATPDSKSKPPPRVDLIPTADKDSTADTVSTVPTFKITEDECFNNFKKFIKREKSGLKVFYPQDEDLKKPASAAKTMVEKLFDLGCKKEVALQLSILILYDMVMLIDDSPSMETEQEGQRIVTLKSTMKEITSVYDLANPKGIRSIKFLNAKKGLQNIKSSNWRKKFEAHDYNGMTRIGTSLQKKILDKFVWESKMIKPLLVMIITDGDAEGERNGMLEDVLRGCVEKLEKDLERGKQAVAFHFSRVGNDLAAQELLDRLDNSATVGDNVDCLGVHDSLEKLADKDNRYKWVVLPKLLLGAIMQDWDEVEEEGNVASQAPDELRNMDDDEEDEEGSDDDE